MLENFDRISAGLIFGLLYWAVTTPSAKTRVLSAVCAICGAAVSAYLSNPTFDKNALLDPDSLDQDQLVLVYYFLRSVSGVEPDSMVLDLAQFAKFICNEIHVDRETVDFSIFGEEELRAQTIDALSSYTEVDDVVYNVSNALNLIENTPNDDTEILIDEIDEL